MLFSSAGFVFCQIIFGNVWDEARVIVGNTNFYEGTKAPTINKAPTESFQFSTDIIHYYFRK